MGIECGMVPDTFYLGRIGHLGMNMTFSILNRLLTFALIAKNIILYSESVLDEKNRFKKPVSVQKYLQSACLDGSSILK